MSVKRISLSLIFVISLIFGNFVSCMDKEHKKITSISDNSTTFKESLLEIMNYPNAPKKSLSKILEYITNYENIKVYKNRTYAFCESSL